MSAQTDQSAQKNARVREAAREICTRWLGGGEAEWAVYAWGLLAEAGLVPADLDPADPAYREHAVRFGSLVYLSRQFNAFIDGGYAEHAEVPDLSQAFEFEEGPEVDVDSLDEDEAEYFDPEWTVYDDVREEIEYSWRATGRELVKIRGSVQMLYADLRAQSLGQGEVEYPLDDEMLSEVFDRMDGDSLTAHNWVDGELG